MKIKPLGLHSMTVTQFCKEIRNFIDSNQTDGKTDEALGSFQFSVISDFLDCNDVTKILINSFLKKAFTVSKEH